MKKLLLIMVLSIAGMAAANATIKKFKITQVQTCVNEDCSEFVAQTGTITIDDKNGRAGGYVSLRPTGQKPSYIRMGNWTDPYYDSAGWPSADGYGEFNRSQIKVTLSVNSQNPKECYIYVSDGYTDVNFHVQVIQ